MVTAHGVCLLPYGKNKVAGTLRVPSALRGTKNASVLMVTAHGVCLLPYGKNKVAGTLRVPSALRGIKNASALLVTAHGVCLLLYGNGFTTWAKCYFSLIPSGSDSPKMAAASSVDVPPPISTA